MRVLAQCSADGASLNARARHHGCCTALCACGAAPGHESYALQREGLCGGPGPQAAKLSRRRQRAGPSAEGRQEAPVPCRRHCCSRRTRCCCCGRCRCNAGAPHSFTPSQQPHPSRWAPSSRQRCTHPGCRRQRRCPPALQPALCAPAGPAPGPAASRGRAGGGLSVPARHHKQHSTAPYQRASEFAGWQHEQGQAHAQPAGAPL